MKCINYLNKIQINNFFFFNLNLYKNNHVNYLNLVKYVQIIRINKLNIKFFSNKFNFAIISIITYKFLFSELIFWHFSDGFRFKIEFLEQKVLPLEQIQ